MQCKNCGILLDNDSKICPTCGTPVENNVQQINNIEPELNGSENVMERPATIISPIQNTTEHVTEGVAMFNNSDSYESPKSKKGIIALVLAIIIILVGLLGFGFYLLKSPKMIFSSLINKVYKEASAAMVDFNTMSGSFTLQTNIETNDESNMMYEIINNVFVGIDYELDYNNKTALTKITTKYSDEKLVDLEVYLKESSGYVLLKDIYDKYISVDLGETVDSIFETTRYTEDHKIVLSELKTAISKSLKSKYFDSETEELTINDVKVKTTKNSLELEHINSISKDIIMYLVNSEKFIESASKISEVSENELISEFNDILDMLKEESLEDIYDDAEISIYTKGLKNEVVKIEFVATIDGEKEYLSMTVVDDHNLDLELVSSDTTIFGNIKITENDGKEIIDISLSDDSGYMTVGLTMSSYIDYNKELSSVNVQDSIDVNLITEEEYNTVSTRLMESPGVQKLLGAIGGLSFGTTEPDLECGEGVDCYYEDEYYYEDDFYYDEEF